MQEKKTLIFTRPHKKIYATEDKIIKVFDNNYKKSDVLNEARNEALVEENTDLNVPSLSAVSKTEEGWALIREKVEGTTLAELMTKNPNKLEEYMETFVDLQLTVHQQRVPTIKTLRHKLMDQITRSRSSTPPPAMSWPPACRACLSTTSSATGISIPATSSWTKRASCGSSTGHTLHRAMPRLTPR